MEPSESWDAETVQDAVNALQDIVLWTLTPQRWEHVAALLERIDTAYATRDAGELRNAVAELELSGPVRIMRIGSTTATGVPQPVLDRRNTLVHSLTSERKRS
ncbi:CATRA system-associated protein [Paractinoplanes globisporus]|uniref:CATRA system-associated protein n=1 Tax=Paractinoplanes globisporus TaxID=113565 RepID=A0ABW6WPP1_9ACTN|nr:CATRA system-associated protein [Actinoplanes globisporus]